MWLCSHRYFLEAKSPSNAQLTECVHVHRHVTWFRSMQATVNKEALVFTAVFLWMYLYIAEVYVTVGSVARLNPLTIRPFV